MKLHSELLEDIQRFLELLPARTRQRGNGYFARGDVRALQCVKPDRLYTAVVRGGEDYQVGLEFADHAWAAECSCPVGMNCKHIVAAMMELRKQSSANGKLPASARARVAEAAKLRWQKIKSPPRVSQPPPSPLCLKLVENLGRELLQDEANFIRQVQSSHHNAGYSHLTEAELGAMAGCRTGSASFNDWKEIAIWPDFPRDDFSFWLYVAWELRRRNLRWPAFMDGITDFSLIEAEMTEWEREKEIEQWKSWFREFQARAPVSDAGVLELRLAVFEDEARLQWRTVPAAEFADLKQAQAKKLAEQFESGALTIAPDSLPLWSATFKPWHYESWWSFKYADATARPALNRLLRLPLAPDRVVTADGQPLARACEPLRLDLHPPQNGHGCYELALATADGSVPPRILCTLRGQPTHYLTQGGLFHGPPADALDIQLRKSIPASALETSDGLGFLHATGVPLPEHLAQRIHSVPVNVTISCRLRPTYPGSQREDIVIAVMAQAAGMSKEKFTPAGWEPESHFQAQRKFKPERGLISVHDRTAQKHFPRVLEALGLKWDGGPGAWTLRLTKKSPEVFVPWLKMLPSEIEVLLDPELATLRDEPVSGTVALDVAEAGIDWFDLKVALNVSDTTLTPEELNLLLNARGGYVRLGKKGWRRLQFNLSPEDEEQLARLGLHARDFSAEPQRFHALQLADEAAKKFLAPERVERIQRRAGELKARVAPALPPAIRAEMRPYQTEGFHFLAYLASNRFGGVLADDMGLGKTLQTLAWLAWLREQGAKTALSPSSSGAADLADKAGCAPLPCLVVCPKSVMDNWRAEAERFYPDLRVRLWRGELADELPSAREGADLIVVNYAQLRSLSPPIAEVRWLAAILDEAQCIKNPDS